ncbi:hypothetical protein VNO78_26713 [Psophocarpus tetragonolobus]|uniref:LOB domain-containing protein n=1 Tax=Psophocarpus tetragonolobus TaxID=3891 RepID=A0AAN9S071_PSOTE
MEIKYKEIQKKEIRHISVVGNGPAKSEEIEESFEIMVYVGYGTRFDARFPYGEAHNRGFREKVKEEELGRVWKMSSSNSPCAACKLLRRKCTQECVFAPYFPPDNPQRFACVHRVFGASNVSKLLSELSVGQRDDAVKSLAYEAEARLHDPVYGCVGFISSLQQRLREIQMELHNAKKELSIYVSPQAMQLLLANPGMLPPVGVVVPHLHQPMFNNCGDNSVASPLLLGGHDNGQMVIHEPQQQEFLEAQQMVFVARDQHQQQQVMLQNHEQQDFIKFNDVFEPNDCGGFGKQEELLSPSLALGNYENVGSYQMQQPEQHHPIEAQLLLSPQQQSQGQQHHSETEDGGSIVPT